MLDQYKGLRDSVIHSYRIQTIFKDLVHNVLAKNVPDVEQLGETNDNEERRYARKESAARDEKR